MKKIISVLMFICLLCSCSQQKITQTDLQTVSPVPQSIGIVNADKQSENVGRTPSANEYTPLNFETQKAVWISYIDLAPMLTGKSEKEFRHDFEQACENIKGLGCNTVYVHVRAFGDAYYSSKLFPWSKGVCGNIDLKPDFDPLEIMIDCSHESGLSFHAWINPLRCETEVNIQKISDNFKIRQWYDNPEKYDEYLVKVREDDFYWLNPAISDVRRLIADGVKEIVENYKVDGIHMDDYFYPTTEKYFDAGAYVEAAVQVTLDEWRLDNCSQMVREIYKTVKTYNSEILFGISPQGNIENNYAYMFADVKLWASTEGYLDYIAPQIYFGYENKAKPFADTIIEWSNLVACKEVSLVIGLAPYKIRDDVEFAEDVGIISEQISDSFDMDNCNGVALYNYINLFGIDDDVSSRMSDERKCISKTLNAF